MCCDNVEVCYLVHTTAKHEEGVLCRDNTEVCYLVHTTAKHEEGVLCRDNAEVCYLVHTTAKHEEGVLCRDNVPPYLSKVHTIIIYYAIKEALMHKNKLFTKLEVPLNVY